jgi:hypothetical protein
VDIYGSNAADVVKKLNAILGSKKRSGCPSKELLAVNVFH